MAVPLHLADQPLLLLCIHGVQGLHVELTEFGLLDDPIVRAIKREVVVEQSHREIQIIQKRPQGNIPDLLLGRVVYIEHVSLAMEGGGIEHLQVHREASLLQHHAE